MNIDQAIEVLNENYKNHVWDHNRQGKTSEERMMVAWPGKEEEEIVISAHSDVGIQQKFHRHEFFFLNFAMKGDFKAQVQNSDQPISIHEGDCYMAQPYSGYAVTANPDQSNTIVAILIQRNAFFRDFFSMLSLEPKLLHFFLDAETDPHASQSLYFAKEDSVPVRTLIELMCIEYAQKSEKTQAILKPLVLSLFMYLMRQYEQQKKSEPLSLCDQMLNYISKNYSHVTLKDLSEAFSYHPNYVSSFIKKETGKSFSKLVLEHRMENSIALLKGSTLSIEEIAGIIGYNDPSNFYKAFKDYFGKSPREFLK